MGHIRKYQFSRCCGIAMRWVVTATAGLSIIRVKRGRGMMVRVLMVTRPANI